MSTTTEAVQAPDPTPMQKQGNELIAQARSMRVTDDASLSRAAELLTGGKALAKSIEEAFAPAKKAAHEAWKRITALETSLLTPLKTAETLLKGLIGGYQYEQDKLRRAEEQRLAAEAQRRRQDELEAQAVELEAAGQHQEAEALVDEIIASPPPAPVVTIPKPKVEGITTAMVNKFEILDKLKLKPEFLIADESRIRKLVQALGKDAEGVVGEGAIRVTQEAQVRVAGR